MCIRTEMKLYIKNHFYSLHGFIGGPLGNVSHLLRLFAELIEGLHGLLQRLLALTTDVVLRLSQRNLRSTDGLLCCLRIKRAMKI
jgi:hypothetical protein